MSKRIRLNSVRVKKMCPQKRKPRRGLEAVSCDDNVVVYRCQTCGREHEMEFVYPGGIPFSGPAIRFLMKWHSADSSGRGASGYCPYCAREYRKAERGRRSS